MVKAGEGLRRGKLAAAERARVVPAVDPGAEALLVEDVPVPLAGRAAQRVAPHLRRFLGTSMTRGGGRLFFCLPAFIKINALLKDAMFGP